MQYIEEVLDEILDGAGRRDHVGGKSELHIFDLFKIASASLDQLDVLCFSPDKRFSYVVLRQKYRNRARSGVFSSHDLPGITSLTKQVKALLRYYGYEGVGRGSRKFGFVVDDGLREIIERDYAEFNGILMPDRAWKSSVVMAGSILEALLTDVLASPKHYSNATQSPDAPKRKGKVLNINDGEWSLASLIAVSVTLGLIPETKANAIDQILRDYRNFVHPKKEIRAKYSCTEAEAYLAKGALDSILNHFESSAT